ncbi:N-acetylmuramoyl-L-alanine amidase [Nitrosomonas oligotropha]|uniref:N-acetylmuramoyl-L-alanine amidase n=1 Tax=Nitrosomonas oligotropha TaxID=42354 RepID=UPI0013718D1F|nr:N-acetylmuramoyl-L-alanine amidase [Nitrosomonas oligotropha]MXS82255.1 N-acetylmuramoyl-L-alanine amidase [Nitrosomonas oligotropha]
MITRQITGIVIHCSGTPNGQWHNVQEIDQWHQAQGFERAEEFRQRFNSTLHAIGYHFVIYPNGAIATGRHLDEPGQHTKARNLKTIGICLIGTNKFTAAQWGALRDNVRLLREQRYYPTSCVAGCAELDGENPRSPGFSVADWLAFDMRPLLDHILEPES